MRILRRRNGCDKNFVQITVDTDAPALAWMTGAEAKPKAVSLITPKVASSGLVIATVHHPFWVAGDINAWIDAAALKLGMWLRASAGTYVQATSTKYWTIRHQPAFDLRERGVCRVSCLRWE